MLSNYFIHWVKRYVHEWVLKRGDIIKLGTFSEAITSVPSVGIMQSTHYLKAEKFLYSKFTVLKFFETFSLLCIYGVLCRIYEIYNEEIYFGALLHFILDISL